MSEASNDTLLDPEKQVQQVFDQWMTDWQCPQVDNNAKKVDLIRWFLNSIHYEVIEDVLDSAYAGTICFEGSWEGTSHLGEMVLVTSGNSVYEHVDGESSFN